MAANILAIHVLDELRDALTRFGGQAAQTVQAAAPEIQQTLDWLAERVRHWQIEVERRRVEVERTRAALERCRSSAAHDRDGRRVQPDCSGLERALAEAQARLRQAEAELRTALHWLQQTQQAAADYRREAERLMRVVGDDLPKAAALLGRSAGILQSYVAMSAPSVGAVAAASAVASSAAISAGSTAKQPAAPSPNQAWFRSQMAGMTRQQRGAWGEAALLAEIRHLQHRVLIEHGDKSTTPGYDSVSWDGRALHIWEAKNYSAGEEGTAGVVRELSAFYEQRMPDNVRQFLDRLPESDPDRAAITQAAQAGEVQWHIRLGPDTDLSFSPLGKLDWGSVEGGQYTYADMVAALAPTPAEPLKPPMPVEQREGGAGGAERGG